MASEPEARAQIDRLLVAAGWHVQDPKAANLHAGLGVAIREFPLKDGHGFADYMLYVDGKAAGVLEAKKKGFTLSGVETQSDKYLTDVEPFPLLSCTPSRTYPIGRSTWLARHLKRFVPRR